MTPDQAALKYYFNAKCFRAWLRNMNYRQYQQDGRWWDVPESIIKEYLTRKKQ